MRRDLRALEEREHDLIVVGGGAFGCAAAWDAAQRGLGVALIERDDIGGATSANSFKMIHGGIRYLQHLDWPRLRESVRERRALLRMAPHLTRPLPIVVPTYARGLERKTLLRAAFALYDLASSDRNRGIADPTRHIPATRFLSREECLRRYPGLHPEGLTGAGVFHDGQMYNPPRLALAMVASAARAGALTANHLEATDYLRRGDRVEGVRVRDRLGGDSFDLRGRVVLNAAGAWAHRMLVETLGQGLDPAPTFSRDTCFVVDRELLGGRSALAVKGRTKDPDAKLARGTRHLFLVPWRGHTLVGVWHVVHRDHPDRCPVSDAELEVFLDEINDAYPLDLTVDDVALVSPGLVLFGDNREGAADLSYGKRSRLVDHAATDGLDGLITLVGVRWTTCRGMAEQAVNLAFRKLGRGSPRCVTAATAVHGGDLDDVEGLAARIGSERPGLSPQVVRSLALNHGSAYGEVLAHADERPDLAETLGTSHVLRAEVVHAVREEMACTLRDVALRRTDLASGGLPEAGALEACADAAALELGWDAARRGRELEALLAEFPPWRRAAAGTPGAGGAGGGMPAVAGGSGESP